MTGSILLGWRGNVDTNPSNLLKLDPTQTFEEEVRDFGDPAAYSGARPFDGEAAKTRIDTISRALAICWTVFLAYIILAQGFESGWEINYQIGKDKWASFYLVR